MKVSLYSCYRSPFPWALRTLFAYEFREDVLDARLDFPFRQARRMRIARGVVAQILSLQPVAVRVVIGVFVEMRHFGPRPPAGDHLDQLVTIEKSLVQIGSAAWRARIAATVTIDPMAELAVRLVLEQALAERRVLSTGKVHRQKEYRCANCGDHAASQAVISRRPDCMASSRRDTRQTQFRFLQWLSGWPA